jgi:hypothetical protein
VTGVDYAELTLAEIDNPDSEALSEALNYLDLLGHTDAAVRLANAAGELNSAIQHAYDELRNR